MNINHQIYQHWMREFAKHAKQGNHATAARAFDLAMKYKAAQEAA